MSIFTKNDANKIIVGFGDDSQKPAKKLEKLKKLFKS